MLLITLFFISNQAKSQITLHEDAEVSLLTASPWNGAVYALFGHTAIYIHDDSTGVDAVFNYGYFDPTQPNFIYLLEVKRLFTRLFLFNSSAFTPDLPHKHNENSIVS
jgi:hypothetical protein